MGEGVASGMDWNLVISICNIVISSLLGVALFYVGSKASKIDKLEDRLRAAASEAVDLRFSKLSGETAAALSSLHAIINEIQRRLAQGDAEFRADEEQRHKLELRTLQQIEEIKRSYATRDDLKAIEDRLLKLQVTVNAIAASCSRNCEGVRP